MENRNEKRASGDNGIILSGKWLLCKGRLTPSLGKKVDDCRQRILKVNTLAQIFPFVPICPDITASFLRVSLILHIFLLP
jgi:hypothetical protein